LDPLERRRNTHMVAFHRDLLTLRREDPVFREQVSDRLHGAVLGPEAFVLRFLGGSLGDRILLVNLGRDLHLTPVPEPLLAPPRQGRWEMLWSSENPEYHGSGHGPVAAEDGAWNIPGHCAVVLYERRPGD
jgi:maltooligosyltrehalose trehalohydrolase